jgi:hypothetical protein
MTCLNVLSKKNQETLKTHYLYGFVSFVCMSVYGIRTTNY